ncbi:MAG: inositol monophosphatase family protein [Candidatus Andersenbacteria bacterium]
MLTLLETTARECGEILRQLQKPGLKTLADKEEFIGAHITTEGDEKSQALAITRVRAAHPNEVIIAEEDDLDFDMVVPPDCTVMDPVDGTLAYYNGCREYGVTLCTLRNGQPHYGVMYFPGDDILISAERDKGWSINGVLQPQLTWDKPLDKTMIGTDFGPWSVMEVATPLIKRFCLRSIMVGQWGIRGILFQETGMYFNLNVGKIWDWAAGALILEEAGGIAVDPKGRPLTWGRIPMDFVAGANQELVNVLLTHTTQWKGR